MQPKLHCCSSLLELAGVTRGQVLAAVAAGEAGLEVEGVVFVVDCMFEALPVMDPGAGLEAAQLVAVSRAAAASRAAPAGFLRAGHCFRLCTPDAFAALPEQTVRIDQPVRLFFSSPERRCQPPGVTALYTLQVAPRNLTICEWEPFVHARASHLNECATAHDKMILMYEMYDHRTMALQAVAGVSDTNGEAISDVRVQNYATGA